MHRNVSENDILKITTTFTRADGIVPLPLPPLKVPDSKVHGTNTGPTWALSAADGPHVGPMNLAIRGAPASPQAADWWPSQPLYYGTLGHLPTIQLISTMSCDNMERGPCEDVSGELHCTRHKCNWVIWLQSEMIHFQTRVKDRFHEHFLWNDPQVDATRPHSWLINISSGNRLVPVYT